MNDQPDQPDDWVAKGFAEMRGQMGKRAPLLGKPVGQERPFAPVEPETPVEPLPITWAHHWAGTAKPEIRFLLSGGWMPLGTVGMLSGDGGAGKTFVALHLAACVTSNTPWLGHQIEEPGGVLFVTAEDAMPIIKRRLMGICDAESIDLAELYTLGFFSWEGGQSLLVEAGKTGHLSKTANWKRLERTVADEKPVLVILDNLANFFGGDEIDRQQAQTFIGMLRQIVGPDAVLMLISHPSQAGAQSGTGYSGSTAWNNGPRWRFYLIADKDDRKTIFLRPMKNNYGPLGEAVTLRWDDTGHLKYIAAEKPLEVFNQAGLIERIVEAFRTGHGVETGEQRYYRADERSGDWGGFRVAELAGVDIGYSPRLDDLDDAQKAMRKRLKLFLRRLLEADEPRIHVGSRRDPVDRKTRPVYLPGAKPQDFGNVRILKMPYREEE